MIDRTYAGHAYVISSDGEMMHDQDAPMPPADLLAQWEREAREGFAREVAEEVRKELRAMRKRKERG